MLDHLHDPQPSIEPIIEQVSVQNTLRVEAMKMTMIQRRALELMAEENLGCLLVKGFGWVWPTNIRNDYGRFGEQNAIAAATLVVEKLEAK